MGSKKNKPKETLLKNEENLTSKKFLSYIDPEINITSLKMKK